MLIKTKLKMIFKKFKMQRIVGERETNFVPIILRYLIKIIEITAILTMIEHKDELLLYKQYLHQSSLDQFCVSLVL